LRHKLLYIPFPRYDAKIKWYIWDFEEIKNTKKNDLLVYYFKFFVHNLPFVSLRTIPLFTIYNSGCKACRVFCFFDITSKVHFKTIDNSSSAFSEDFCNIWEKKHNNNGYFTQKKFLLRVTNNKWIWQQSSILTVNIFSIKYNTFHYCIIRTWGRLITMALYKFKVQICHCVRYRPIWISLEKGSSDWAYNLQRWRLIVCYFLLPQSIDQLLR